VGHCRVVGQLWFVIAAVCAVAGLFLLWLDRRRRTQLPEPPPTVEERPGDLFRES
jgi:hypothetical protein